LYLIEILHQTTTRDQGWSRSGRCILLKFYIKPQLLGRGKCLFAVVSYWNSTSNHNDRRLTLTVNRLYFIEILHQTTTVAAFAGVDGRLYLIEILHQTTTMSATFPLSWRLYLIEILHQTTTVKIILIPTRRCILSKFYIKPQPERAAMIDETSCILSKFYIKPQHRVRCDAFRYVVSYRNSTSNHN